MQLVVSKLPAGSDAMKQVGLDFDVRFNQIIRESSVLEVKMASDSMNLFVVR